MTIVSVELKVAEAQPDDVNKGIVRIDSSIMKQIDVSSGDIIEIEGERVTVGIVDRAYPGDIGLSIIRMDGLIRRNARTSISDMVKIKKADVVEAKKLIVGPARQGMDLNIPNDILKRGLLGRPVTKGDIVSLGGTKSRRKILTGNPLVDEMLNALEEESTGFGFGDIKLVVGNIDPKGSIAIISDATNVAYSAEIGDLDEEEQAPDVTYEDIGGLKDEIKKIREMVELPLKHPEIFERLGIEPPNGVLLHGAPGTGKTMLAKAVASETNSHFLVINGPEIMSKFYGQSEENLRNIFEEAEQQAPSIIFIDEVDAIAIKREEVKGEVERRVVAQLLSLMDGLKSRGKVVVIAATNIPNMLDPALRRPGRFDREIEIGVPDREARLNILKIHTRNMPLVKSLEIEKIAEVTHGFVGADLASLCKESAMVVLRKLLPDLKLEKDEEIPKSILNKMFVSQEDFFEALKAVRPSAMREVFLNLSNTTWDDIGGLTEVKQELKEAVEWPLKHPDAFTRLGVKPPQGILLYGAPGTGKTLLAKAVAHESAANFILVKGPELLSKWVGESEKAVRKVFHKARMASPSIIFFDEMDSIAPRRGASSDNEVTERVVNQILTEMDGLEQLPDVVVIAATNRPDIIDPALLRPGRFDRILHVNAPDLETRKKIFEVHTSGMSLAKDLNIKKLAEVTEGYVGADIESICREAAILALREDMDVKAVSYKHFETALLKVRPSVSKEIEETYKSLQDQFKQAQGKQIQKESQIYFG